MTWRRVLAVAAVIVSTACGGGSRNGQPATSPVSSTSTTAATTPVTPASTAPTATGVPLQQMLTRIRTHFSGHGTRYSVAPCYGPDQYTDPAYATAVDPMTRLRRGTVLICGITTEPPSSAGQALIVVLDDNGTFTWETASDLPDWAFFRRNSGQSCSAFLDDPYFGGLSPDVASPSYKIVLAYWFLEHEPARLDTDHNGKPCEKFFSPQVVAAVWAGADEP